MYQFQNQNKLPDVWDNTFDPLLEEAQAVRTRAYWNVWSRKVLLGTGGLVVCAAINSNENNLYRAAIILGYSLFSGFSLSQLAQYNDRIRHLEDVINEIKEMKKGI